MGTASEISIRALREVSNLPDLMTRAELAAYTGISVSTLATWAVAQKGPRLTKLGQAARYRREHVLAWIEASTPH